MVDFCEDKLCSRWAEFWLRDGNEGNEDVVVSILMLGLWWVRGSVLCTSFEKSVWCIMHLIYVVVAAHNDKVLD